MKLKPLQACIAGVKAEHGLSPDLPVKWNFRDLAKIYNACGKAADYNAALPKMDVARLRFLEILGECNCSVLAVANKGHSITNLKTRREYHGWALTNILQRLGFDCGRDKCENEFRALVHLDWPGADVQKSHFDVYHAGYWHGVTVDGTTYKSGPLREKGFAPALSYGSTEHDCYLQLADIVVGACREFLQWCLTGNHQERALKYYPLIQKRLRTIMYYSEFDTGLVANPREFRGLVARRSEELHKLSRAAQNIAP